MGGSWAGLGDLQLGLKPAAGTGLQLVTEAVAQLPHHAASSQLSAKQCKRWQAAQPQAAPMASGRVQQQQQQHRLLFQVLSVYLRAGWGWGGAGALTPALCSVPQGWPVACCRASCCAERRCGLLLLLLLLLRCWISRLHNQHRSACCCDL